MTPRPLPRVDQEFFDWYRHRATHILPAQSSKGIWRASWAEAMRYAAVLMTAVVREQDARIAALEAECARLRERSTDAE